MITLDEDTLRGVAGCPSNCRWYAESSVTDLSILFTHRTSSGYFGESRIDRFLMKTTSSRDEILMETARKLGDVHKNPWRYARSLEEVCDLIGVDRSNIRRFQYDGDQVIDDYPLPDDLADSYLDGTLI